MPPSASPLPASPPPSAGPTQPRAAAPSQPRAATPMPGPDPLTPPPLSARPVAAAPKVRTEEQMAELQLRAQDFAPLDFSEEIGEPGTLRTRLAGGIVTLSWDKLPELTLGSLYRVVSADDQPGWAPEYGELIDITSDLTTADDREFASAVRYYQVWRNSGTSWHEAVSSQPRLHAQASIVVPIQGLTLREDGGRVIGQWSVYPGVNRVHVYRIPIERAAQAGQDPQFLIATEDPNLHGFIDRDAARGKRFLYRFYAEASVEGVARLSAAVGQTIAVSALLSPVTDLTAHGHGTVEDWMFDLTWSDPPAGRVAIYRTQAPPSPGLGDEARDEAALVHGGLRPDDRLAHPTHVLAAGPHRDARGAGSARLGPGLLHAGHADRGQGHGRPERRPGGHPRARRAGRGRAHPVPDAQVRLARRRGRRWPSGSSHPQETAMTPQEGAAYWEVSRDAYERLGAFRFPTRLPSSGCSVHVAGMSFVNRERVYGTAAVTQYLGLLRMSYSVELKRTLLQRPERLILRMAADIDLRNCPPFVCVFNETRLPLHHKDGEPLPVSLNSDDAPAAALQFRPTRLAPPPVEPATFRVPVRGPGGLRPRVPRPAARGAAPGRPARPADRLARRGIGMTMTEVPGPVRRDPGGRFGQLTYTSFDQRGGSGGWQVKDRVALSDDEADALRSRVNTQLDAGTELPRFPTPEDIARLPATAALRAGGRWCGPGGTRRRPATTPRAGRATSSSRPCSTGSRSASAPAGRSSSGGRRTG